MSEEMKTFFLIGRPRSGAVLAIGLIYLLLLLLLWGTFGCIIFFESTGFRMKFFLVMWPVSVFAALILGYGLITLLVALADFIRRLSPETPGWLRWLWAVAALILVVPVPLTVFLPLALKTRQRKAALAAALTVCLMLLTAAYPPALGIGLPLWISIGVLLAYAASKMPGESRIAPGALYPGAAVLIIASLLVFGVGFLRFLNAGKAFRLAAEHQAPALSRSAFLELYYAGNPPNDAVFHRLFADRDTLRDFGRGDSSGERLISASGLPDFADFRSRNAAVIRLLDLYSSSAVYETLRYSINAYNRPGNLSVADRLGVRYYLKLMQSGVLESDRDRVLECEERILKLTANRSRHPGHLYSPGTLAMLRETAQGYRQVLDSEFFTDADLERLQKLFLQLADSIPEMFFLSTCSDYQSALWSCDYAYERAPQVAVQAFLHRRRPLPVIFYSLAFWGELDRYFLLDEYGRFLAAADTWRSGGAYPDALRRGAAPRFAVLTRLFGPREELTEDFIATGIALRETAELCSSIRQRRTRGPR